MIKNISYVDLLSSTCTSPSSSTSSIIPLHVPRLIKLPSNKCIYTCIYQFKYDNWIEYYQENLQYLFILLKKNEDFFQNLEYEEFTLFCYEFSSKTKPSFMGDQGSPCPLLYGEPMPPGDLSFKRS